MTASANEPQHFYERALRACDAMDLNALRACDMHALSEVHLRLIVMKPHAPAAIVKYMVQNLKLCPSEALDVAAGPRMVKLLLSLGADPGKFTFFKSDYFQRVGSRYVANDGEYAEVFRRSDNLFPAFGLRIVAGAVLPWPLRDWFDDCAQRLSPRFIREHGSKHMETCYAMCKKRFQALPSYWTDTQ